MKKIISILLVAVVLMSTVLVAPSHALVTEIVGGSYVAYAILAAALAAAGYTVATSQVNPEVFQGILDSPDSQLVKALIGGTTLYLSAKGQVYFNWTASQWSTFLSWVNTTVATGNLVYEDLSLFGNLADFVGTSFSSYITGGIVTNNNSFGFQIGASTVTSTLISGTRYYALNLNFQNNVYFSMYNNYIGTSIPKIVYGSNYLLNTNSNIYCICLGVGLHNGSYATSLSEVNGVQQLSGPFNVDPSNLYINGHKTVLLFADGVIKAQYYYQSNRYNTYTIAPTVNFTTSYTSLLSYMTDVINTGALVGDWSGIGNDVINPAQNQTEVGIDAYPDYETGVGADAVPDVIDGTIDIPLDRYIDTPIDLSQDPVPIDFTPWQDKTIDTTPEDVIPDIRLNPPADVTADPDTPWADEQSDPIDYPIDTATEDVPNTPNPNPDPSGDTQTNRLKLMPLILSKFPFCIPWDLHKGFKTLVAPGEAPVFEVPLHSNILNWDYTFTIDLSSADRLSSVSRWFLSALWVVILIIITRKIVWK